MKKKLTKTQIEKLKQHSVHHTKKHLDMMKHCMQHGMSFEESHKTAQKFVGK